MSILGDKQLGVALAKRLERGRVATWKPISTPPKYGQWVLIYGGKSRWSLEDGTPPFECGCNTVVMGCRNINGIWEGMADNWTHTPTHWMPLPAGPEESK